MYKLIRTAIGLLMFFIPLSRAGQLPAELNSFIEKHCLDCHDTDTQKGDLDLEKISFDVENDKVFGHWVKIFDQVRSGEMPPKKKKRPEEKFMSDFLSVLQNKLLEGDLKKIAQHGRSDIRRLNRFEYENSVREALSAPWLRISDYLPEDGTAHLFNKVGGNLDVSHVQIEAYLHAAEFAVDKAISLAAFKTVKKKYYARDEPSNIKNFWYRFGQNSATRATIPLLGHKAQPEVIRKEVPVTVGENNPEVREQEAIGVVSGTYTATLKYDFNRVVIPTDGSYKIRLKSYTFMAGPNGRSGGKDHGLETGSSEWWRPDRNRAFPGKRTEPITIYALKDSGDSRWTFTYDAKPQPEIVEKEIFLEKGETIRPDAGRLVRTRPGWKGNANASKEGVPGFALNWLEVEGPLHESWPPPSFKALFGDLPFKVTKNHKVNVISKNPESDARRLLLSFMQRSWRRPVKDIEVLPYWQVYKDAVEAGDSFTEAMKAGFITILCSPAFIYLEEKNGTLDSYALASRLSYFLWNGAPDELLKSEAKADSLNSNSAIKTEAQRLLSDEKSTRFVDSFLDYWLNLRDIQLNPPDATLYPDYYLDDQLTESSLFETRMFFKYLINNNRPVRELVDANYTFLNETLAGHYGIQDVKGIKLRKVDLPVESTRGGLLTQASILRVTANGTTTSPVIRGAWITERILGVEVPPPPSGVEAIEPDTRGATTIREQLDKHRSTSSCKNCHMKFDPVGFALENFDVAGGWQTRYRSTGEKGAKADGIGKNGHLFKFRYHQSVDASGKLIDGQSFSNISELKRLLVSRERLLAENLLKRLVVFSTGSPVRFSEREEIDRILKEAEKSSYGVRDLILELVQSKIFKCK